MLKQKKKFRYIKSIYTATYLGQIYLLLMDRPSFKCVIKKPFLFCFEFNENWWSCSYLCLLKVSLNLNKKVFLMINGSSCPLRAGEFGLRSNSFLFFWNVWKMRIVICSEIKIIEKNLIPHCALWLRYLVIGDR